jgi:hypothetical protein
MIHALIKMSKGTDIDIAKRKKELFEMVIRGVSKKNIIRYTAEKYNIKERQTESYLAEIHEEIKDIFKAEKQAILSKYVVMMQDLYRRNYLAEDYKECRNILNDISDRLVGKAKSSIDITTDNNPISIELNFGENKDNT